MKSRSYLISGNFQDDLANFCFFAITFTSCKIFYTQKSYPLLFALRKNMKSQKLTDENFKKLIYIFSMLQIL